MGNGRHLVLSSFVLKILAILCMTLDHVKDMLLSVYPAASTEGTALYVIVFIMNIFGRMAMPLFCLMLAEGLRRTKDRVKYLLRLSIIFGIMLLAELIISFTRYGSVPMANAFADLLAYALFIFLLEQKRWPLRFLAILPVAWIVYSYVGRVYEFNNGFVAPVWALPNYIRCDYSLLGFLFFLGFYYAVPLTERIVRKNLEDAADAYLESPQYQGMLNATRAGIFVLVTVLFWALSYLPMDWSLDYYYMSGVVLTQTYCLLAIVPIILYSGKRGYDAKWFRYFEYLYYPMHLAIIALIFVLI